MKLIIQIPCYNESETLPAVLGAIPRHIEGISEIESLVIDDGSGDDTAEVATRHGAHHVIRNARNMGLAYSFRRGIDEALALGADFIVNIDGDNQYPASEIPLLVAPLLSKNADIVIGDRQTNLLAHFSPLKKVLQKAGSALVRVLSGSEAIDAVSGFRAFTRAAAFKITVLTTYSYTIEMILQARSKGLVIANVPIRAQKVERQSRLMRSLGSYLIFSGSTIIRIFTMYNPLKVFAGSGGVVAFAGILLACRFLSYYFAGNGTGHVQSLILAAVLIITGFTIILVGLLADLIQFNRRLLEDILERVRKLELKEH